MKVILYPNHRHVKVTMNYMPTSNLPCSANSPRDVTAAILLVARVTRARMRVSDWTACCVFPSL